MNFRQLAINSVKRNAMAYSSYLLSSSFSVFIFFTYSMIYFHPALKDHFMGTTQFILVAGEIVLLCFCSIFLLYSNRAFLKVRKHDLGVLKTMGLESSHIKRLIYSENIIVCFLSILSGIGFGFLFSKLFFKIVEKVVNVQTLPLYVPWEALGITFIIFPLLFLVVSAFTIAFVSQQPIFDLLHATHMPESEPRASIFLSMLSLGCLGSAVYLLTSPLSISFLDCRETLINLFIILVSVGNYLLFTQLSVFIIGLLRNNRSLLWRGSNLFTISGMAFKIRDFSWSLYTMTMVTIMACTIWAVERIYDHQYAQGIAAPPLALSSNNLILFISIFIATIFSILSAYLLYFKLYNILRENKEIFRSLHKIGFTSLEMAQAVTIQMTLLFFTPLLIASLEILVSFIFMNHAWKAFFCIQLPLSTTFPLLLNVIFAFLILQFIFFSITRSRYLSHLRRVF